jgi:hypothetical protein
VHNLVYQPHYRVDDFAAFRCDDLIEWQGQATVSFGMLGRVAQIFLFRRSPQSGEDESWMIDPLLWTGSRSMFDVEV